MGNSTSRILCHDNDLTARTRSLGDVDRERCLT